MKRRFLLLFVSSSFALLSIKASSQNLIENPGAELPPIGNGWTKVSGNWTQRTTDPAPYEGNAYFFAGANAAAELYQDIDVSSNASAIDNGMANFTFIGHVRSYSQSPADQSREIVEYRNNAGDTLSTFTSPFYNNTSGWFEVINTKLAPSGTRTIRIRLLTKRNNGSNNDGYHDGLSLTLNSVLPLKIISFSAINLGKANKLTWQTSQEINSSYFLVQRSIDGIHFEDINRISASGSSNYDNQYQFIDEIGNSLMNVTKIFYRLKVADKDGHFEYGKIISVSYENKIIFLAFPNPVIDDLIIKIDNNKNEKAILKLMDLEGRIVQQKTLLLLIGTTSITMKTNSLSKGNYILELSTKNFRKQIKVNR